MTSPLRRYADIIVHRQLWNVINNIPLNKPDITCIFKLNYYKQYYKQLNKLNQIANIANQIGDIVCEN